MPDLTPMMRQYFDIKEKNPGHLLFFRLGDFYEMFGDDARFASNALGLTLTTRDRGVEDADARMPMCGVPYHSAAGYIARLIGMGRSVAVCEQVEDPATAKGLVAREVVRVITPGTVLDGDMLDETSNNYIAAVCRGGGKTGVCFADISAGIAYAAQFNGDDGLKREIERFAPKEIIETADFGGEPETSYNAIAYAFGDKIAGLVGQLPAARAAVLSLIKYLNDTQKRSAPLGLLILYDDRLYVEIDETARRNLELTEALSGGRRASLLGVLDATCTPMGARLLRSDIERPLRDPVRVDNRLAAAEFFLKDSVTRSESRLALKGFPDIERMLGRLVYGQSNPREVRALGDACAKLTDIRALLQNARTPLIEELFARIDPLTDMSELIASALLDQPAVNRREGGVIRDGYHPEVDRLREIKNNSLALVAGMEAAERAATGIKSLKISYNQVFGYYIEVSKSNLALVPGSYIRKQTLANCERYITGDLKNMESTILSAQERLTVIEGELFDDLSHRLIENVNRFQSTSRALARLDVILSHAETAERRRYVRPAVDLSDRLDICEGRHPVVEPVIKDGLFVPNDVSLGSGGPVVIITGPNMAGKSTYMRQTALIAVMAHIGSFVPAKSARVGILDKIFTRIGAHDDLAGGRSTFMVEMTEVADILRNATKESLLILDEIGRGTSTYDGMAVARAVLERVAEKLRAKTLFSTHYHELTALEGRLSGVRNFNVAVKKRGNDIIFLHKIIPGGADDSYGVEVARLAGLPDTVIRRARVLLAELEAGKDGGSGEKPQSTGQISLEALRGQEIIDGLLGIDVNTLTPIEALQTLYKLQSKAKGV